MRIFNTSSRLGQYHSLTQVLTQYQYQFQYQKCSIPIPKISSIEFPGQSMLISSTRWDWSQDSRSTLVVLSLCLPGSWSRDMEDMSDPKIFVTLICKFIRDVCPYVTLSHEFLIIIIIRSVFFSTEGKRSFRYDVTLYLHFGRKRIAHSYFTCL